MTDQYAVVGNPVEHSKSPQIHALFAEQTDQDIHYGKLLAPLDAFQTTVLDFFTRQHGKGLNVTVPFKQQAWDLCDERSDYAELAGAVNTLVYRQGHTIWGTNTDGIGLVTDLIQNNHIELADKRILILGAGGAVRGVLQPVLDQNPAQLFIANRTESRAHDLATLFGHPQTLSAGGYAAISEEPFDVIINGTAASLQDEIPPVPREAVQNANCCYDMMYASEPTAFVKWAQQQGVPVALDGLGMLIEQAAESFAIWRGVRPDTHPVFTALRE